MVKTTRGVTFIELLIAIAIIGSVALITVPRFVRYGQPAYQRKQFLTSLDSLLALGWQQAILTQKIHAFDINFDTRRARVEVETDERDRDKEKGDYVFKPVTGAYITSEITIPNNLVPHSAYIEGKKESVKRGSLHLWFFLVPEGLAQEVVLNLIDNNDVQDTGKPAHIGLVLNPFTVRFNVYDSFQKP